MSGLVLPGWVARNERVRRITEDQKSGVATTRYWNPLLKQIDRRLELVFMPDLGDEQPGGTEPWRWHIMRTSDQGMVSYWPLQTETGGYREMAEDILSELRAGDLWNPVVKHDIDTSARRNEASQERANETRREGRVDELRLNLKALDSPGVNFSRDVPWSARPGGRRGRARKAA